MEQQPLQHTIPVEVLRPSPRRWLAVLHLAKRECGNCKAFSQPRGQLTLLRIRHFDEVMRHVSPMQIGRANPQRALEAEREKISKRYIELEMELPPLLSRRDALRGVGDDDPAALPELREVEAELAPLEREHAEIRAANPRLVEIEKELEELRASSGVVQPEEQWVNYGACDTHRRLVYCGSVCGRWA